MTSSVLKHFIFFSILYDCVIYNYNMCDITFDLLSKSKIIKIKIKIKIKQKEKKRKSSLIFTPLTIILETVSQEVLELEWQCWLDKLYRFSSSVITNELLTGCDA